MPGSYYSKGFRELRSRNPDGPCPHKLLPAFALLLADDVEQGLGTPWYIQPLRDLSLRSAALQAVPCKHLGFEVDLHLMSSTSTGDSA